MKESLHSVFNAFCTQQKTFPLAVFSVLVFFFLGIFSVWAFSVFFKNGPLPASFSILSFQQLTVKHVFRKFGQLLESNHGPVISEAAALSTDPQPQPAGLYHTYSLLLCSLPRLELVLALIGTTCSLST